ncbi:MAG: DNA-binding protein [Thermodesulfobacteriota bacterium]
MDDRIYSEIEAAAIRGVSVKKLQAERWRRKGMPYVKDGRRVGYLGKDIRADIERNRVVPSAA